MADEKKKRNFVLFRVCAIIGVCMCVCVCVGACMHTCVCKRMLHVRDG